MPNALTNLSSRIDPTFPDSYPVIRGLLFPRRFELRLRWSPIFFLPRQTIMGGKRRRSTVKDDKGQ
jgi:hypothetical protein